MNTKSARSVAVIVPALQPANPGSIPDEDSAKILAEVNQMNVKIWSIVKWKLTPKERPKYKSSESIMYTDIMVNAPDNINGL